MSSEFEFHASFQANPLQKKRKRRDKRIVEIVREKAKTEKSIAFYMRQEILHGTTAHVHRFKRLGERYGWGGSYMYTDLTELDETIKQFLIDDGARNATDIESFLIKRTGFISGLIQSLAILSQDDHNLKHKEHTTNGESYLGYVTRSGEEWEVKAYEADSVSGNLILTVSQWVTDGDGNTTEEIEDWDTGLPGESSQANDLDGFAVEYNLSTDEELSYGFFSTDQKYKDIGLGTENPFSFMPFVSLKDDGNNEEPYYKLPKTDIEYKKRKKILKTINIDFDKISDDVFVIKPIPNVGTPEWDKKFGKAWRFDQDLQDEYPTEQDYFDDLNDKNESQQENSEQLSDVHIGFAMSPGQLDETSAFAMLDVLRNIVQEYDGSGNIKLVAGSLKQEWSFTGIRMVEKQGIPKNIYDEGGVISRKKNKSSWYIKSYSKKKNEDGDYVNDENYFEEDGLGGDDNDTILVTHLSVGDITPDSSHAREDRSIFELRTLIDGTNGEEKYLEIRIAGWKGKNIVTQLHNSKYPDGPIRTIADLDLCDFADVTFQNGLIVPLTFMTFKKIPVFKRDRLVREILVVAIQGIAVTEVPWYATTFFKILMFLLVVIATIVFAPAGQVGASLLSLAEGMAVSYALSYLAKYIKSPILMAIITFTIGLILGGGMMNCMDVISLTVEATGTYLNQVILLEHLKLQKKEQDLLNSQNKQRAKLKKLEEEFGLNKADNTAYILYLASLPPVEHPNDFFGRALNTNLNEISLDGMLTTRI